MFPNARSEDCRVDNCIQPVKIENRSRAFIGSAEGQDLAQSQIKNRLQSRESIAKGRTQVPTAKSSQTQCFTKFVLVETVR